MELDNLQRSISSKTPENLQAVPTIINEDREVTGTEVDLRWNATKSLTLGLVTEIRSTDNYSPDFYNGSGQLIVAQKTTVDSAANYTFMIDWMPDFGVGTTNLHIDFVFEENINDQQVGLEEYKKPIDAYFKDIEDLNARLSWANNDDTLEFGLWGKNLLDNRYIFSLGGYAADVLNVPHGRINRGLEVGIDIKETAALIKDLDHVERYNQKIPCALLNPVSGSCNAYLIRPSMCRSHFSVSKMACLRDFKKVPGSKDKEEVPMIAETKIYETAFMSGVADTISSFGFNVERIEITSGLSLIWENDKAVTQYLKNIDIFKS